MISIVSLYVSALTLVQGVAAHGKIYTFTADGVDYIGLLNNDDLPSAAWSNTNGANFIGFQDGVPAAPESPIPWSLQIDDAICGKAAHPGLLTANVSAGGYIDFDWTFWPGNHFGPIMTYMADCHGPCQAVDKTTLEWFKIQELGLVNKTIKGTTFRSGTWAAPDLLNANAGPKGSTWRVIIPTTIAPGNYVVRTETVALHYANEGEIQYYPFCFSFKVTGSGTVGPPGLVHSQLYHQSDPGFNYNVFADPLADYIIPGPPLAVF
ncbi:glycoside hydrolase [Bisporella sp. PMI_857]|nr:glycoside hydrolase [Bisporella sp. PMI_857]